MTGFISCSTANAKFQEKLNDCDGNPIPAGTEVATCENLNDALAGLSAAPSGAAGGALTGTYPNPGLSAAAVVAAYALKNCAGVAHAAGANVPTCTEMNTAIAAGVASATIADATETVKGKVELATTAEAAAGTSTTLAVTPAGVAAAVLAQVPDTAKTVRGLVNLTDLQQMGDGRKVFDAGVHVGNGNPAFAGRGTVTAIGPNAGANNTGDNQTATGRSAGLNNTGGGQTATGHAAGFNNTGGFQTATGHYAGYNNTGDNQTATGRSAGLNNTGANQTATGLAAGFNNTGVNQTATGQGAGYNNTGANNSFYGAESGSQAGALLGTVTMTPSSSSAGTVSPALPASVVGTSRPVFISGFDWRVLTFTSTTAYTTVGSPASGTWTASVVEGLAFNNVTALGYDSEPTASNQVMLGNGAVTEVRTAGTYFGTGFTTVSDSTLKEHVEPIDATKALQFRNGLQWKHYEVFAETQSEVKVEKTFDREETVVNEDGTTETKVITVTVSEPTGAYKVTRVSQGFKYGLIAQDVQALAETVGAFADVVVQIGEYFTLDAQGYPAKDAAGNNIVNKRFGLDYDAINVIQQSAEQYDSSVSMRQARLALLKFDLLDKVEAAVAGADKAIQIDWEFAQSVNRNYGSVTTLAKALGITDKQLNELFAYARTV